MTLSRRHLFVCEPNAQTEELLARARDWWLNASDEEKEAMYEQQRRSVRESAKLEIEDRLNGLGTI